MDFFDFLDRGEKVAKCKLFAGKGVFGNKLFEITLDYRFSAITNLVCCFCFVKINIVKHEKQKIISHFD